MLAAYADGSGRIGYRLRVPLRTDIEYYGGSVAILVDESTNLGDPVFQLTKCVAVRSRVRPFATLAGRVSVMLGEAVF